MSRHLYRFFALAFSCGFISSGCSIHPLPKDVTGYETPTLVRKIRCEARDAVRKTVLEILHKNGRHQEIADIESLDPKTLSLNRWEQQSLADVQRIGIVYDFSLQGIENGGVNFNADIIKPLSNGTETYSPSLSDTLKRDNTRTFTVSDNFYTLLMLGANNKDHCKFLPAGANSSPNYQYPIAGRIGLDEMIQTFVRLAVSGDVVGELDPTKVTGGDILSPAGPPTMVDTLIFTTTVGGGLNSMVMLSPMGTALQLKDASLMASASRMDVHMVTIGLAMSPAPSKLSPGAVVAALAPQTSSLFLTQRVKSLGSGEALAGQAIIQHYIRRDLLFRGRGSIAIAP